MRVLFFNIQENQAWSPDTNLLPQSFKSAILKKSTSSLFLLTFPSGHLFSLSRVESGARREPMDFNFETTYEAGLSFFLLLHNIIHDRFRGGKSLPWTNLMQELAQNVFITKACTTDQFP